MSVFAAILLAGAECSVVAKVIGTTFAFGLDSKVIIDA